MSDRPRRTARTRLALTYAGLFFVLGTAVVAIILLLTAAHPATIDATTVGAVPSRPVPPGGAAPSSPLPPRLLISPTIHRVVVQQHSADVRRLLLVSWVVMAIAALASIPLGWFAAGRMLRPLRRMTSRARTISAGNLHERLAVAGPADEFKQLGDAFDDLLGRLEGSFDAQRRFVANAAHELRTPLTLDRTLLQVALADPGVSAATLRATCEELLASGRDQERLLEAMLTLASSERGLDQREPVDLADLAARALEATAAEIERCELQVTSSLAAAPTEGDPELLQRLVSNLIDNAVSHNVQGGSLEVRTELDADRAVVIVENSGPQIWADQLDSLFEPFRRLAQRTAADSGHHGLGLSIVRAIVTAHGGAISAQPRPDGGLSVSVSFAAVPPAQD